MRERINPQLTLLEYTWAALLFVLLWVHLPYARAMLGAEPRHIYLAMAIVFVATSLRTALTVTRPKCRCLLIFPIFDAVIVTLAVHFTGGIKSDLWLLYYFQLLAAALDPYTRPLQLICPLVIVSYVVSTYPDVIMLNTLQILGTRLFFLFLAGGMTYHIAHAKERLSNQLSSLQDQLTVAEERTRIARELHDGIGHRLVNCVLNMELCSRLVCKENPEASELMAKEQEDLRAALDEVRSYVHALKPIELEAGEMVPLLRRHVNEYQERTGIKAELMTECEKLELSYPARLVLLRIVQEALSNAAKHSDAQEVMVLLAPGEHGGAVCAICDNGRGFDVEALLRDHNSRIGFGLETMKERAEAVGGEIEVQSSPQSGTTVRVWLPGDDQYTRRPRWSLLGSGAERSLRSRRARKVIKSTR